MINAGTVVCVISNDVLQYLGYDGGGTGTHGSGGPPGRTGPADDPVSVTVYLLNVANGYTVISTGQGVAGVSQSEQAYS